MTTYIVTLKGGCGETADVEVHAPNESQAIRAASCFLLGEHLRYPPTELELIMNLYVITFWPDPEDPDNIVEIKMGARTAEIALAEARLQHPELADAQHSVTLEWEGSK